MADKPIVSANDVKSKYINTLSVYNSYTWHLGNYPTGFPTGTLGTASSVNINTTLTTPNPNDIINAANTITNVIKTAAKGFTAIVTCHYRRWLDGDAGATDPTYQTKTVIDDTKKALFNAQYLVNFTNVETDTGNIIYDTKIDNLLTSIRSQIINAQNRVYTIDTHYCHCLYENSLIDIKICENGVLHRDTISITLNDLKHILHKEVYVKTPKGYCKILNYFENGEKEIYEVIIHGDLKLYCTRDHKIFYSQDEFKPLSDYAIFDQVYTSNGLKEIIGTNILGKANTIDIEVDNENHNFYANEVLVSNSSCHSSCFSGDTILTIKHNDTIRNITFKELSIELLVLNTKINEYQIETPTGFKLIKKFHRNGIKELYLINNQIECTLDHKFVVDLETNKKVQINKLLGKSICLINNQKEIITSIKYLASQLTYDLEVDSEEHNYVINNKYIVSNCHGSRSRR